ncbi:uncharacterized protein N7479_006328 [Penicillium vulpinum]|uniref:non-specific serine/threonine protein kinase n=1 Tax=Penicillium vulpinum TaxID=29845 RepID=A0A1V6RFR7_9EURO|nr:uncharacterized protein N7479_006328 [Penicillium vulpinum]KAJ5959178.1 hypothetical protein N7479_006328 [Penicillium vulpinum]OQE00627.1 hypothetical protein PENVUL_c048G01897 [Penicillium vulpinum]
MSTRSPSPVSSHATPMEPKQSKSKSVAQRRVYGKSRANAPRAVFDGSPARDIRFKLQHVDPVESLQAKLAQVTINDDSIPQPDNHAEPPKMESEQKQELGNIPCDESSPSTIEDISDTPTTQSSIESSLEAEPKLKKCETMVEVRICSKALENFSQIKSASPATTSESISQDREKRSASCDRRRAERKKIPASRRSSGVVHDSEASTYVGAILTEALSPIAAQGIQKFGSWASRSANMFDVAKLAEGSYGEVYKLHLREEACRPVVSKSKLAKLKSYGDGVFKVVPLRAKSGPGSKKFTTIDEIVSEVKMLKYLDPIPGFARFREIHVVQGRFPESFQNAWDHYKKTKDDCINPNPSNKRAYPDTQLWAIVEMDDAGCELEKFAWSSIFQIYDIFWGVAMALARAEEYAMFEHRDLHLGNVCIRSTREDDCMEPPTELDIARKPSSSGFGLSSLETTIIDYSLSRADLLLTDDPTGLTEVASSDLDKKQLFDAIGQDEDEIMQRNTYRYMRATLYTGCPIETEKVADIPGIWAEYSPRTNLIWLLFLLQSLFKNRKPETSAAQPQRKALAPCSPNKMASKLEAGKEKDQSIAGSLVKERQTKDVQAGISRLKQTLEGRLKAVLELLDLEHGHEDMCCAADLVAYAMDSQWLGEEDFF